LKEDNSYESVLVVVVVVVVLPKKEEYRETFLKTELALHNICKLSKIVFLYKYNWYISPSRSEVEECFGTFSINCPTFLD
jgi:hypothetical protein